MAGRPNSDSIVVVAKCILVYGVLWLLFRCFPQLDGPIAAAAGQELAAGAKGNRYNAPTMPAKGLALLPALRIPQLDGPIAAAAGQKLAVGAEGNRVNQVIMPAKGPIQSEGRCFFLRNS